MIDYTQQIVNQNIPYPTSYLCYLAYNNKISLDDNKSYNYNHSRKLSNPTVTTTIPGINKHNYLEYSFGNINSVSAIEDALKNLNFNYDPQENKWSLRIALDKLKWCKENFLQLGVREPACTIL